MEQNPGGDRAERQPDLEQRLQQAEDTRERAVWHDAWDSAECADVDQHIADADHGEKHQRHREIREPCRHDKRRTPQRQPEAERPVQPTGPDDGQRGREGDHSADADGPSSRPITPSPSRIVSMTKTTTMTFKAPRTNVWHGPRTPTIAASGIRTSVRKASTGVRASESSAHIAGTGNRPANGPAITNSSTVAPTRTPTCTNSRSATRATAYPTPTGAATR
jgi:hypothetical protein